MLSTTWSLVLDVKHDWVPLLNLRFVQLDNMLIGPNFPACLQTQTELDTLMACLEVKKRRGSRIEGGRVIQLPYLEVF